jgi:hypothetical protein
MKIKILNPNEILTTKDFPVHNIDILKIYFKICQKGHQDILPPTPVIPFSVGFPLIDSKDEKSKEYNKRIKKYLKDNPRVKYLMLDGSHKTTALTLTHKKIHSMILKSDKDINEVQELINIGEIFGIYSLKPIKESLSEMANHFKDAKFFESVEDKTKRMVKEKVIPDYMIDEFRRKN